MRLRFKRYFSHHRAKGDGRSISRNVASLNIFVHDVINLLYYNFKIHYDDAPCDIYIKNVAASLIKGRHLKINVYLQIISIGLSDLIWKVFATIMNLTNENNKKSIFFVDPRLININCDLRLPLDKITYFEDTVIRFNGVDKIVNRGKTRYFVEAYVCKSKIMLPASICSFYCYNSLNFFSKNFFSSLLSAKMFPLLTMLIVPVNNKIEVSVAM